MTNEENAPETQVQSPAAQVASTPPEQGSNKPRFLDRFSRGPIAAVAAVLGIVVGMAGSHLMDHHERGGWGGHQGGRFGMERGGWGGQDGGPGVPPGMRYRQGGAGVAPGAQQAPQGSDKSGAAPAQPAAPNGQ
ncbi:MAG: hypothetical protein NTX07_05270 [Solirubrobacterales bacterium]|nr:hypothetical protein [Solirubrobacterales bacterium]